MTSTRSDSAQHLGRSLENLSDVAVATLLANAEPLATGIGGSTAKAQVEGEQVFIKQVPLTTSESGDVRSTAHRFGLPMACHYGIGSASFGVGREIATHELTSRWMREGATDAFPLLLHWRVLEQACPIDLSEFEGPHPPRQWGAAWPQVKGRVNALRDASASVVLFLEYVPETLEDWLRTQLTADARTAGVACAGALDQIVAGSDWMRTHGLLHLDVHPRNILVHHGRLLFTDFGLSIHESFDLDDDERMFFGLHGDYDRDTGVTTLLHWILAELGTVSRAQRLALLRSAAADGRTAELERALAPLDGTADLVVAQARTAVAMTVMFDQLMHDASATTYDRARSIF